MTKTRSVRCAGAMALAAIVILSPAFGFAQEAGGQAPAQGGGGAPGGGAGGQTPGGTPGGQRGGGQQPGAGQPGTPTMPGQERAPNQFPELENRPIYLSGKVKLADGTEPPDRVMIERVCNGVVRPESYTDARGNFSFQLGGRNSEVFIDASVGNPGFGGFGGQGGGISEREISGCEIRANLPGFQSDSILLGFRRPLDNPDIGIIHLHRLAKVEGYTFSITTAQAPRDARRAYEKGVDHMKKKKWADAEKELAKAVGAYPKYAIAWHELGLAYQQQKKLDDAGRAYEEAIKADSKFINPYGQLALIAVVEQDWEGVVDYTSQMVRLNPYLAPDIYFFSAVANYNLKEMDMAEDHARQAAKLDSQHRNPKINHLLGVILAQKEDYAGAAENMRLYLKLSPKAPDIDNARAMLADLEKLLTERTNQ